MSRKWLIRVFSVPYSDKVPADDAPGYREGEWYFTHNGEEVIISDSLPGMPLFPKEESIALLAGDMACIKEDIADTTYGIAIINAVLWDYSSADAIPYMNKEITGKLLTSTVSRALKEDVITVDQHLRIREALNHITVLAPITVTAFTPKLIVASKEILALRDQLLAQYKDQLTDPAIIALIDEAISNAIRDYLKDDPSAKFLLKSKHYDVVLKKLYYVQGGLARLDDPTKMEYIGESLETGSTVDNMAAKVNASRSGSYDRGASTADGGAGAKISNQMGQNLKVAEPDCGTKVGKLEHISNIYDYVGRYLVGSDTPLTPIDVANLQGKTVLLRDPTACKTGKLNFCAKCMGDAVAISGDALGPYLGEICNVFMSNSLAAFHGIRSHNVPFDPFVDIV